MSVGLSALLRTPTHQVHENVSIDPVFFEYPSVSVDVNGILQLTQDVGDLFFRKPDAAKDSCRLRLGYRRRVMDHAVSISSVDHDARPTDDPSEELIKRD